MDSIVPQHINQETLKSYYLYFDENGNKSSELLDILMDSLLEFVFGIKYRNIQNPKEHQKFFNACEKLYKDPKARNPKREGDLGEIILHTLLRKYVGTIPFAGRFYFAVDKNTSPKSFDIVHVLPDESKNILVLGESKMYADAKGGIDALADDIKKHFNADYVRKQFVKISEAVSSDNLVDQETIVKPMRRTIDEWEYKLRTEKTLENVIDALYIPLLCTYNYDKYSKYTNISDQFIQEYETHIGELYSYFDNKNIIRPACLNILLMLFPIPSKDILIEEYYKRINEVVE
ncbi:TPA: DUF1837 domain-containing protein [Candidatus Scatousia excrementigallinarum]|uniref:DUF1837 domain-containing protein n=1 Tax=Candidatus Scatousia excrementigallinarum TaxID=2840935 RepID=A0A9D1EXR0_9BACT|nr:DUF1837 domain-containing protein [Candidatus Scatousia excrementigallinarum]